MRSTVPFLYCNDLMNQLTATFRIVTPMFLGGAEQEGALCQCPAVVSTCHWNRPARPSNRNHQFSTVRSGRSSLSIGYLS